MKGPLPSRLSTMHGASRRGAVLFWAVLTILAMGILGIGVIQLASTARETAFPAFAAPQARLLAEAGLSHARYVQCTDGWPDGLSRQLSPLPDATVTITRSGDDWTVLAVAFAGTAMEARANLTGTVRDCGPPGGPNPPAAEYVVTSVNSFNTSGAKIYGDVAVLDEEFRIQKGGDGVIEGSVYAAEGVRLIGNGTVLGNIYTDGAVDIQQGIVGAPGQPVEIHAGEEVEVGGSSKVYGTIYTGEDAEIGGGSEITGDIHACTGSVEVGGSGNVIGNIFAFGEIEVSGGSSVSGDLHSLSDSIEISVAVGGSVYAGEDIEVASRNRVMIGGDAHAGESIELGRNARIGGNATAGNAINRPGQVNGTTCAPCTPVPPTPATCPESFDFASLKPPPITTFSAGGPNFGSGSYRESLALAPGSYGNINLNGFESSFRLSPGSYYFNDVRLGSSARIYLDLSGGGEIRIFIKEDFRAGNNLQVFVSETGSPSSYERAIDRNNGVASVTAQIAERIYLEAHGAVSITSAGEWFGSLHTPFDDLSIGNGSTVIGALFGRERIDIAGVTVRFIPPLYFQ